MSIEGDWKRNAVRTIEKEVKSTIITVSHLPIIKIANHLAEMVTMRRVFGAKSRVTG